VDPQPLAVAYDELLERLFVGPAELAGALERECALRFLRLGLPFGDDRLRECRLARTRRLVEGLELREPVGARRSGRDREGRRCEHRKASLHASPLPAGTSTSRLPLVCIGVTRPARSICSMSRAAR